MRLAVLRAVAHLFHIQRAFNKKGVDRKWLYLAFHRKIADWKALTFQAASRPTHLSEIVCWEPTHLGFCDTSGLGSGSIWLDPTGTGNNLA